MKYILWQREHSPSSIVGTIEAPTLVAAANTARAMWGSFYVVEWNRASLEQRVVAALMDERAELRQRAATV